MTYMLYIYRSGARDGEGLSSSVGLAIRGAKTVARRGQHCQNTPYWSLLPKLVQFELIILAKALM